MTAGAGGRYARFGWVAAGDADSMAEASAPGPGLTHVAPRWFVIDAKGSLHLRPGVEPAQHAAWVAGLQRRGIAVLPAVGNPDDDGEVVRALVDRDESRRRAVAAIEQLCREGGYDGVTLEARGAFPGARDAFSAFVEELAWSLHASGARLALVVPPQVTDPAPDPGAAPDPATDPEGWLQARAGSFDYRTLGAYADLFIVDTRDFPRRPVIRREAGRPPRVRNAPGAVAPEGWLQSVIDHALLHVPVRNLILTLPLYGRAWPAGGAGQALDDPAAGRAVPLRAVQGLLAGAVDVDDLPDPASGGRRITWTNGAGEPWVLFTDDAVSLETKAGLIARYDLGGVAFWRLGFGTRAAWDAVDRGLTVVRRPV